MTAAERIQIAAVLQRLDDMEVSRQQARAELRQELGDIHQELYSQAQAISALKAVCEQRPAYCAAALRQSYSSGNGDKRLWALWGASVGLLQHLVAPVVAAVLVAVLVAALVR